MHIYAESVGIVIFKIIWDLAGNFYFALGFLQTDL